MHHLAIVGYCRYLAQLEKLRLGRKISEIQTVCEESKC